MVGILFGITAVDGKKPYHYSHINGVSRDYQSKGVGFKLKRSQREHVIHRGQGLVKWTYDPLQAGNAVFNIRKLGATCRTYRRDLYGELDDSLNRGRLTDRFEVEWWIKTRRVEKRIRGEHKPPSLAEALADGAEPANATEKIGSKNRGAVSSRLGLRGPRLLVEIPESIVRVRDASLAIAHAWTLHVRRIFESYFRRGYVATDVLADESRGERRVFYLLETRRGS
jgi:predicted GNAT superfamily acetyltransferase